MYKKTFKRRGGLRRKAAPKYKRKQNLKRRINGVPEWASLTEILTVKTTGPVVADTLVTNVMYSSYNLSLALFSRASAVGQSYREFRIKNVKVIYKPLFDTYQASQAGGTVPYLYYLIDRTGSYQNITTVEQLKRMGARPMRLDDKNLVINYRPSVLNRVYDNTDGGAQFNQYKLSPWLSTNDNAPSGVAAWTASGVDHLGIRWCVNQNGNTVPYQCELQIEFQFRKPMITGVVSNPLPVVEIFPDDVQQDLEDINTPPE